MNLVVDLTSTPKIGDMVLATRTESRTVNVGIVIRIYSTYTGSGYPKAIIRCLDADSKEETNIASILNSKGLIISLSHGSIKLKHKWQTFTASLNNISKIKII